MKRLHRYYAASHPPIAGTTLPKGAVVIHNFNARQPVHQIGQWAYGYAEYEQPLTNAEIEKFGLVYHAPRASYGEGYNIDDIERFTEEDAWKLSEEYMRCKGHSLYFVDFGGRFGYSMLVFRDGAYLHYANDYELHHNGTPRDELRKFYISKAESILFEDDEYAETPKSYLEYKRKKDYLHNHYGMLRPHISMFHVSEHERERPEGILDTIGFGYYADAEFVKRHVELYDELNIAFGRTTHDYNFWFGAFKYEMENHEYVINWQGDYDVLNVFGTIDYAATQRSLSECFEKLCFTEEQKRAYLDARESLLSEQE